MSDGDRSRSQVQEDLFRLYLRLNGFFVTPLIIHSQRWGDNRTEIDALGVRLPCHAQPDRQVDPSPILAIDGMIDVVMCEVKSRGQQLQFNDALLEHGVCELVLQWAGVLETAQVYNAANLLRADPEGAMNEGCVIIAPLGKVRIRLLLASPERWTRRSNQPYFLCGEEVFGFVRKCLRPDQPRDPCSTAYDLTLWGETLSPIVAFFKKSSTGSVADVKGLYDYPGVMP